MPRPLPILFVHGFSGDPGDWTDTGFRQYLIEHGSLDPDLVRLFHYGAAADGTYNNRGDVRQIASRLAGAGVAEAELAKCSVDRLSQDSVAKGGPRQVTLVAHSMGGIISRYYLSRRTPDEFGTVYRGNVGRLITIGSPHRGVDLLRLAQLAPRGSLPWRFVRLLEKLGLAPALPASAIEAWDAALERQQVAERRRLAAQPAPSMAAGGSAGGEEPLGPARILLTDSPIVEQLAPNSPLLNQLNAPGTMPTDVECHCFFGDIRIAVRVLWGVGGPMLLDHTASFGDLAVPAASAMAIPGAASTPHAYVNERRVTLNLRIAPAAEARSMTQLLPEAHAGLLANPEVHDAVMALLND